MKENGKERMFAKYA